VANKVKEKIAAGQVAYGVWADVFDADLIELCGYLGYDYAVLDAEHTDLDPGQAKLLIRACEVAGMVPIVRVPEINEHAILRYLEIGAVGIYVPHVNTADEARAVVDAVKYHPVGHRGAGSMRALRFGVDGDFTELCRQANEDTMVIVLIEERRGIDNLDEIMAVPGVDVVGIGPGDLSHTMGHVGEKSHPDVVKLVVDSEARVRDAGHVFDSVVGSVDEARDCVERGSLMVSYGLRNMVTSSAKHLLAELDGVHAAAVA
jgi:4-hydroxy-2-oxoheptanedioate aldolase